MRAKHQSSQRYFFRNSIKNSIVVLLGYRWWLQCAQWILITLTICKVWKNWTQQWLTCTWTVKLLTTTIPLPKPTQTSKTNWTKSCANSKVPNSHWPTHTTITNKRYYSAKLFLYKTQRYKAHCNKMQLYNPQPYKTRLYKMQCCKEFERQFSFCQYNDSM